jgi:hypothetical protein
MIDIANDNTEKTRTKTVPPLRVFAWELAAIDANAKAANLSRSAYMRRVSIEGKVVVQQSNHDKELLRLLLAIGNNLNQIAKKVHLIENGREFTSLDYTHLKALLGAIDPAIERVMA